MLAAISAAARGLAAQSQRVEAVVQAVASRGTTAPAQGVPGSPVRIGALPLGDGVESMATLVDAELAFRMNAAVIATAADMLDSLLDAVSPSDKDR